jgi:hypothetical protein
MIGKRVSSKKTGETGTVIKRIGNCLWVKMDNGSEYSGARQYWKVLEFKRGMASDGVKAPGDCKDASQPPTDKP